MSNGTEYVFQLIWYLIAFLLVIGLAYYITRFIGQSTLRYTRSTNLQVIDYVMLGRDKGLYILKVGNKFFLIGVSNTNITYLTEINKEDLKFVTNDKNFVTNLNTSIEKLKQLKNKYLSKKDGE
ncbi:flagellar biosynthetic protein FliO [Thermoanaerobacter mathranii subsp. mathranii str. A3]|uniref:Flagellar protein n=2 Tax=Thermoanaerobacter TaxID=1754 RepID=A0ABN3Z494_THEM3|nr:flagellar biosynthetic protein FliO [Thermoanaerobacter mathranii]ADH60986.1 flagellar biosynthetic protein FliO [Thermoanaerobacter mathranii subsp. mathranii str. A3]